MSAALEATGLGKRYKRAWALGDCSLRIPLGCVAGLVGPNGAGKTTLLHLAVGLLQPDAGEIRVLGESPDGNADLLGRVGFVAQDTPLYDDFSAEELIASFLRTSPTRLPERCRARASSTSRRRTDDLADLAPGPAFCTETADTCVDKFSSVRLHEAYNVFEYQPVGRFWTFQLIETGLFAGLAAVLLVLAVYRIRRLS